MDLIRRDFITGATMTGAALVATAEARGQSAATGPRTRLRRIATEEAWTIPEHRAALAMIGESAWPNLDAEATSPNMANSSEPISLNLLDTRRRLAEMDRLGIDMQVLSLTSPGVQLFRADRAVALAELANDRMAEIVRAAPKRFAGLASFAPQDPARAVKEMERAVMRLGLNGFVVNSHTNNEYLDEPKYWPILEAAEALDRPIYIHPRCPSDGMAAPFRGNRLQSAIWGYAVETGTHGVRLMTSGVFDRFPKLQIILGHMGENIPFHLWRTDHWFHRRPEAYKSKLAPFEVMKRNFMITNSGVDHGPALRYAIEVLGADRIMWAIDYPYEDMAPAVEFINGVDISEDSRAAILHRNAERVFHIPELAA
jgi:2,3-dihydroxybenzoate decarboxylase/5-carboxyvanillate decarboxylase